MRTAQGKLAHLCVYLCVIGAAIFTAGAIAAVLRPKPDHAAIIGCGVIAVLLIGLEILCTAYMVIAELRR